MIKATAAILLLVLTVTQTPMGQLLKLPLLIEHFYKHNKNDRVSLFKFLKEHYGAEHSDADRSEDKQLPFKTVIMQGIDFALLPGVVKADFSLILDVPKKVILQGFYIPQQDCYSIFHPPRA
jgi:hypothetical protein